MLLCGSVPTGAWAYSVTPRLTIETEALGVSFVDLEPIPRRIELAGVTVYEPVELFSYAAAHESASRAATSVAGVLDAIELIYREDGFMLTEAVASHDPGRGVLGIEVHEGHVGRLVVNGLEPEAARRVERLFQPLLGQSPLRVADFERALMLASDLAGVEVVADFVFEPDGTGATLRLAGSQTRQAGSASADNVPLPGSDALRATLVQEGYSLFTGGDMLRAVGVGTIEGHASHSLSGTVYYRRPVADRGAYLEAFGGNAFSRRRLAELAPDSDLRGVNAAVAVGYPLLRTLHGYAYALGEYEYMRAESQLGGAELASEASAARAYLIGGHMTSSGRQTVGSLIYSAGRRPDRAADQLPDGDARFHHVRASLGLVTSLGPIDDRAMLRFQVAAQLTGNSLPEVERFALGHWPHLRGYTPGEVVGDSGVSGLVEVSRVIDAGSRLYHSLAPFAFLDFGSVRLEHAPTGIRRDMSLRSAGIGFAAALAQRMSLSAWAAVPLEDGTYTDAGEVTYYFALSTGW